MVYTCSNALIRTKASTRINVSCWRLNQDNILLALKRVSLPKSFATLIQHVFLWTVLIHGCIEFFNFHGRILWLFLWHIEFNLFVKLSTLRWRRDKKQDSWCVAQTSLYYLWQSASFSGKVTLAHVRFICWQTDERNMFICCCSNSVS